MASDDAQSFADLLPTVSDQPPPASDPGSVDQFAALLPEPPTGDEPPAQDADASGPKAPPGLAARIIAAESGNNPNAKSKTSSATGLGQFTNNTWLSLVRRHRKDLAGLPDNQLLAMRTDPALSTEMVNANIQDNTGALSQSGVPVNNATLYGAHWFGPQAMTAMYKADPTAPVESVIGQQAAAANGLNGKTVDDVKTMAAKKMGMDYMPGDLTWGQTGELALHNALPSLGQAVGGVYDAFRHPLDTASTLKKVAVGLDSKAERYIHNEPSTPQSDQDEALVDALGSAYADKYGSIDGFKQYLAHDPAGVAMDASTVLSGGGALAGKVPGAIGDVGRVAATVGEGVNPLNPLGVVSKVVGHVAGPTNVLDSAGNITPQADALIQKVTKGTMKGSDLVDPDVRQAFAATIAKKGLSEASVREGLLRSVGADTPTSVVTQTAPPFSMRPMVSDVISANNDKLAAHAADISGPASTSGLGAALDQVHTASLNNASAAYDRIRGMPGSFGESMPQMGSLGQTIAQNFQKSGISAADLPTLQRTGYPQAAAALKLLNDTWASGKTIMSGGSGFTAPEVLAMRKALNNFRASASGSDVKAVSDITDAFDNHIADLSKQGLFTDAAGNPIRGLGQQINAANAGYRQHFATFETPNGANNSIVNAVKKLKVGQSRDATGALQPSLDDDLYTQAQAGLGNDLLNPAKGPSVYNQLARALGGNTAPIDEFIKGQLLNPTGSPKTAGALLADPKSVATKAFAGSPDDLSRARHIQAASAINNAKPNLESRIHQTFSNMATRTLWKGISSYLGEKAGEALGPLGGMVGAIAGPSVVEPVAEWGAAKLGTRAAMAGAPKTSSLPVRAAKSLIRNAAAPNRARAMYYENQAQIHDPYQIQRASGGKVDHDALVERLYRRWKAAKRETDKTTKTLLGVPDATIIKALDIAQEHI